MNLLKGIANTGFLTLDKICKEFKVSHSTINKLVLNEILQKSNVILFGKVNTIYELTDKSKLFIRKHGKLIYRTNNYQLEHDYLLMKTYCSLSENIRSSWLNETELKLQYRNITTVDAVFTYKNSRIAVEVLTSNYSKSIIREKFEFAEKYCDKIITLNTNKIKI